MPGLDSFLRSVPVVVGCFSLRRDCFASGAGLGTIGLARWDSGAGLGGVAVHSFYLFTPSFVFLGSGHFFQFFFFPLFFLVGA